MAVDVYLPIWQILTMNPLARYLADNEDSLSAFAVRIGRVPSTLSRCLRGERLPGVRLALEVEAATAGQVSAVDFIEGCLNARKASK